MKKFRKKIVWTIGIFAVLCIVVMLICNRIVAIEDKDTIHSFLGKPIVVNGSICEQIAAIADQDEMLSYSDSMLQIGEVRWRVNLDLPRIVLFTSVQPEDPKMEQVVKYLNRIYGNPYDGEDAFSMKWSSSGDSLNIFKAGSTLVHLRRVSSEEGGTFLMFN